MGPASAGSEDASVFRSLPRTGKSYLQLFSITHPAGKFDGGLSFFGRLSHGSNHLHILVLWPYWEGGA